MGHCTGRARARIARPPDRRAAHRRWCYEGVAGRPGEADHRREWATERVEHAIELHAHLIGERPAGVVVRRSWRPTWIRDVVGMVLWLEHVAGVGAGGHA